MNHHDCEKIPKRMMSSINRYIEHKVPMGSFLTAVFSNDLMNTAFKADDENITLIFAYVNWIFNHAPAGCYGSPENVKQWIKKGMDL